MYRVVPKMESPGAKTMGVSRMMRAETNSTSTSRRKATRSSHGAWNWNWNASTLLRLHSGVYGLVPWEAPGGRDGAVSSNM